MGGLFGPTPAPSGVPARNLDNDEYQQLTLEQRRAYNRRMMEQGVTGPGSVAPARTRNPEVYELKPMGALEALDAVLDEGRNVINFLSGLDRSDPSDAGTPPPVPQQPDVIQTVEEGLGDASTQPGANPVAEATKSRRFEFSPNLSPKQMLTDLVGARVDLEESVLDQDAEIKRIRDKYAKGEPKPPVGPSKAEGIAAILAGLAGGAARGETLGQSIGLGGEGAAGAAANVLQQERDLQNQHMNAIAAYEQAGAELEANMLRFRLQDENRKNLLKLNQRETEMRSAIDFAKLIHPTITRTDDGLAISYWGEDGFLVEHKMTDFLEPLMKLYTLKVAMGQNPVTAWVDGEAQMLRGLPPAARAMQMAVSSIMLGGADNEALATAEAYADNVALPLFFINESRREAGQPPVTQLESISEKELAKARQGMEIHKQNNPELYIKQRRQAVIDFLQQGLAREFGWDYKDMRYQGGVSPMNLMLDVDL